MISVIICSVDPASLEKIRNNIASTIGTPHEIIAIDNAKARIGICEAYNSGAAQAQFELLCFMHEDISFDTPGWGQIVVEHFRSPRLGLIGIAGGDTKSLVPSSWSSSLYDSEITIIQHYKRSSRPTEHIRKTGYPDDPSVIKKVVCLDGVWMCTRKKIVDEIKFDSFCFPGFHGYDIDFSLQVFQHYEVAAVNNIAIHHYSEGNYGREWMENMIKVSEKWKDRLPLTARSLTREQFVVQHWQSMGLFLNKMVELEYPLPVILGYFLKYSFNKFYRFRASVHFLRKLLNAYYGKGNTIPASS